MQQFGNGIMFTFPDESVVIQYDQKPVIKPTEPPVLPKTWGTGTIEEQVSRLYQWQFDNPEWPNQIVIDGNRVGQPGQDPAARFTTVGGVLALENTLSDAAGAAGLNATQSKAVHDALPAVAAAIQNNVDPTKLWETTPSDLDPASMSFLLVWMHGTADGFANPIDAAKAYRVWYYKKYGRQAPPPAPHNPEAAWLSEAEFQAIINS